MKTSETSSLIISLCCMCHILFDYCWRLTSARSSWLWLSLLGTCHSSYSFSSNLQCTSLSVTLSEKHLIVSKFILDDNNTPHKEIVSEKQYNKEPWKARKLITKHMISDKILTNVSCLNLSLAKLISDDPENKTIHYCISHVWGWKKESLMHYVSIKLLLNLV